MRLWILFVAGVLVLAGALWPFGKKTEPLGPVPAEPAVAAAPSAPKPLPPKVIEVIDLARAYEPVPEPDEPTGINPASFIAEPRRVPPAMDGWKASEGPSGSFMLGSGMISEAGVSGQIRLDPAPTPEKLVVVPREVATITSGLLDFESIGAPTPVESVTVMPRVVGR